MLRRLVSVPVAIAHFAVGSMALLAMALLHERMIEVLHR